MSSIALLASCASDLDVVNAARVSFGQQHAEMEAGDDKLINFLLKNHHGTPFEHTFFKFHVEAPIFVFREWHRHRIGHSYNEMSARYVEMPEKFYLPATIRAQEGKPGAYTFRELDSAEDVERADWAATLIATACARAFSDYRVLLEQGVAKEQARAVLPVGTYSQMIWSCNARSLMAFLTLRAAPSAMKEIRDLAEQAEAIFGEIMPITHTSFVANGRISP